MFKTLCCVRRPEHPCSQTVCLPEPLRSMKCKPFFVPFRRYYKFHVFAYECNGTTKLPLNFHFDYVRIGIDNVVEIAPGALEFVCLSSWVWEMEFLILYYLCFLVVCRLFSVFFSPAKSFQHDAKDTERRFIIGFLSHWCQNGCFHSTAKQRKCIQLCTILMQNMIMRNMIWLDAQKTWVFNRIV